MQSNKAEARSRIARRIDIVLFLTVVVFVISVGGGTGLLIKSNEYAKTPYEALVPKLVSADRQTGDPGGIFSLTLFLGGRSITLTRIESPVIALSNIGFYTLVIGSIAELFLLRAARKGSDR